jgi:hypothetical protein
MLKRNNWTNDEIIDILEGRTITWCSEGGDIKDNPSYYAELDYNKGIHKVINDVKLSEKSIWTNDELIELIDNNKVKLNDSWTREEWDSKGEWNQGLEQAIIQLWDFKADPEESYSAMAYDPLLKQIFVISPPLPQ